MPSPPSNRGPATFVERIAAPFPLAVIAWILGVPSDDWELLFRWTNEVIGKDDPEYRRPGETPGQTIKRARGELHAYLADLIEQRRREPRDDLVSELVAGKVDGVALSLPSSWSRTASSSSKRATRRRATRSAAGCSPSASNAVSGTGCASDRELVPDAVEEILRWVSPISHFTRRHRGLRGARRAIRAGDQVALYFASANRDEDVFDDPFTFRVDRRPNPHLAFGFGEHFCVGAHLARVEIEMILRHLLDRLDWFELAGPIERLSSAVNGSIKRLPLRYRSA